MECQLLNSKDIKYDINKIINKILLFMMCRKEASIENAPSKYLANIKK